MANLVFTAGSGVAFAGVTPSATGIYAEANEATATHTGTFAVENAPGVTALIAVHLRTNKADVTVTETSLGAATLVGSAISSAASVYLYSLACPGVDSIELTLATSTNKLDDFGISVYHARDITVGTPQTSTTAASTQTVSITASDGNSVVAFGTANNPNGATASVGVTEDYDDTTWGGGDYMTGGHVDGVSAGTASYGFTWAATPGNSAVIAVEIQAS